MVIAVDFDGTIVEHKYPYLGKEIPFAILTLKRLQKEQHQLILWTAREGKLLEEAVNFCSDRGLEFYAVNANHPDEETKTYSAPCRKLKADLFIDDRNVGGLPDWGEIYEMVSNGWSSRDYFSSRYSPGESEKRSRLRAFLDSYFSKAKR
ncbi:BT0820 family HAD-type phosphatase [Bacteroides faecis]|uniref:Hydrolase n=1 Tax=Bacteroides faecis TaxID=674529 RepID=A0ABY5T2U3_9BACE|nr:hypothetical protein [Bacteroides faecis]MCS2477931.1 hypothetical protein [Bacteroides faecis]MCS2548725.1 hypothetical protein [Bacteroides faecis]MCS2914271.1 hypothetical protein [Bacteroides faecis]MCS2975610.1 hypothetical protein [Bacteroides faecis]UBE47618.1 hypothetical protein K6V30_12065 [Bacteroides faecis]